VGTFWKAPVGFDVWAGPHWLCRIASILFLSTDAIASTGYDVLRSHHTHDYKVRDSAAMKETSLHVLKDHFELSSQQKTLGCWSR
jgi:hypothetical protein